MFGSIFVLKFYASVWRRRLLVVFVAACRCRIRETLNMFGAGAAVVVVACASYSKYQQKGGLSGAAEALNTLAN